MSWRLKQRAATFWRLGFQCQMLCAEAAIMLLVARLWLLVTPFNRIAPRLGKLSTVERVERNELSAGQAETAHLVGKIVTLTARFVPFRALCFEQAVAAKIMLHRRGIAGTLHLCVVLNETEGKPIESHVWLNAEHVRLTGHPVPPRYTEVARFDSAP
jgi:Transglutaminase-like superfamily